MKTILVTGARGFIGTRLLATLRERGNDARPANFDLSDVASVRAAAREAKWDAVVHLAGMSHVADCERDPEKAYRTNLGGTCHLLDALQAHAPGAQFIFPSSAQVYAAPSAGTAPNVIDESWPIAPQNVYASTKWRSELAIRDLAVRGGLAATVLRFFNHTHRTQSPEFFLPYLYSRMSGPRPANGPLAIPVGNLDLWRDLGSLSDLVEAIIAVASRPVGRDAPEVFNVCSGRAKSLRRLAESLAARLGVRVELGMDAARVRPGEPTSVCGSHAKISAATGWEPRCRTEDELLDSFLAD